VFIPVSALFRAKRKISHSVRTDGAPLAKSRAKIFDRLVPLIRQHDCLQNYALFREEFSLPAAPFKDFRPRTPLTIDYSLEKPFFAVHPGCKPDDLHKRWATQNFVELARKIQIEFSLDPLFILGPGEEDLEKLLPPDFKILKKAPLEMVNGALSKVKLFIGNDSGLMHMAAALDKPVAAFFGPSDPSRVAPLTKNLLLIKKDLPCQPCHHTVEMPGNSFACVFEGEEYLKCLREIDAETAWEDLKPFLYRVLH